MRMRFLAALAGVAAFAVAAQATTVEIYFGAFSQSPQGGYPAGIGNGLAVTENPSESTYASQVLLYQTSGYTDIPLAAFCTTPDKTVTLPSGPHEYTETFITVGASQPLGQDNNSYGFLANQTQNTNVDAAGIQLAIWHLANAGDTFSARNGDNTDFTSAQGVATTLEGMTATAPYSYYLFTPTDTSLQSFVVGTYSGSSTPEPFTMALCAGGLGLAVARRRKAKKA